MLTPQANFTMDYNFATLAALHPAAGLLLAQLSTSMASSC
jgi:hypothetical protein